jgi:hypothetical protein
MKARQERDNEESRKKDFEWVRRKVGFPFQSP